VAHYAVEFAEGSVVALDVFEQVVADDDVELFVSEWKLLNVEVHRC
jgi:hypothetical protein